MMLSVMVVGAGAAFSDQSKIKNTEAVDACTALNIIGGYPDGSFKPEGNITRAEVTKMICVALNGGKNPAVSTNTTPTFSDVRNNANAAWAEGYIESCAAQGIVSGVGGGKFAPNGNVTGVQLAKMLLVSLGYKSENEGFTGNAWATNVNVRAAQKGLYKGLEKMDTNAALTRDNAAQMVWNALNAYEVEYKTTLITDKNGQLSSQITVQDKVVGSTNDKITLMEDKYEAETFVGTFEGNADVCDLKDGHIQVTGDAWITVAGQANKVKSEVDADFTYNFDMKYIGEEVKVLYKDSTTEGKQGQPDDKDTIYGVYLTGETTVYNITKADLQDAENGKIKFGDKNYKVNAVVSSATSTTGGIEVIRNYDKSTATPNVAASAFDEGGAYYKTCADTIKFIESDGKITKAYINEYQLGRVTGTSSDKVSISGIGSLKYEDHEIASGLKKDDVVVYANLYNNTTPADGTYVVEKATVVSGKLEAYNVAKGTVKIDGTTYDADEVSGHFTSLGGAEDFITGLASLSSSDLNESFEAYVVNGCVLAMKDVSDSLDNYALVDSAAGKGTKVDPYKVYMILADGTKKTYDVASDSSYKPSEATLNNKVLVKYTINKDGEVKLTNIAVAAESGNSITKAKYDKDTKTLYDGRTAIGVVASDCVLFVRTNIADSKYSVYTNVRSLGNINTAAEDMAGLYKTDDNGKVVAAYIDMNSKPSGSSADTMYGIVTSDGYVTKDSDDTVYTTFNVYANGKELQVKFEDDNYSGIAKGDLIYFDKTSDDVYDTSSAVKKVDGNSATIPETGVTDMFVQVKEYDEKGQILTYTTDSTNVGGTVTWVSPLTLALDDDVVITYVNTDGNKAGEDIGVMQADTTKVDGSNKIAKNAAILVKDGKIIAIYVDDDYDITK